MYYIYEHWRTDTNSLFYIGKGKGRRAYRMSYRSQWHNRIQEKLRSLGLDVEVRIVLTGLSCEEARHAETQHIKKCRETGVEIINMTNGGDGISGFKHSRETREKMRLSALKANTEEVRRKKSVSRTGIKLSKEHREKISISNVGNKRASGKRSEEFCEHMSRVLKGRKLTPEQVEQRRTSMLLRWQKIKEQRVT
jgi:hypothetical protein